MPPAKKKPEEEGHPLDGVGLHSLRPAKGSKKARKRVGRGHGSGTGKTSGRGHKGYGSRSGSKGREVHLRRGRHARRRQRGSRRGVRHRGPARGRRSHRGFPGRGRARRRGLGVKITQTKSKNGSDKRQLATLRSLGLRKIGHTVERDDSPQLRGMVHSVRHLVKVED